MRHQPADQRTRIRSLQILGLLFVVPLLSMHPLLAGDGHEALELAGLFMVLACVIGRMWSILYIGSSKNRDLVTSGPYSITRNPLYFFSILGAAGIGLFVGSVVLTALLCVTAYVVLALTAQREARHLEELFGDRYRDYARVTPLFWPQPSLYREPAAVTFSPAALKRTFLDGLFFLAAFPAVEAVEHLQETGWIPVLFNLP